MANCEDILIGFFTLFQATMDDSPVNKLLKWKVAYKVSEMNKCDFCISVSKVKLKEFGLSDQEVKEIGNALTKKEETALKYAEAATQHAYNIDKQVFNEMKENFSDEQIVEITSVIGLFNFINRFNDSLGVLPDIS